MTINHIEGIGGFVISRAVVSMREIIICRMPTCLAVADWFVPDLELPFPKLDSKVYKFPFDHAEIYFGVPDLNLTVDDIRRLIRQNLGLDVTRLRGTPGYEESDGIILDNAYPNPTVEIASSDGHTVLKFHNFPIGVVVGYDPIETLGD